MRTLIYAQFQPDLSHSDHQIMQDIEALKTLLRGKLPDDALRSLTAILVQPFSERNYRAALDTIQQGIVYLSQYDDIPLTPQQGLEQAIRQSCHEQRALAVSIRDRLVELCGPIWAEASERVVGAEGLEPPT